MKLAFHFPGQGSQSLGMLAELVKPFSVVNETFERASQVLHYDLWSLIQEGPLEKLNQTEFTQPAMLAADFAIWQCWKSLNGPSPQVLAGHSLGEYAALVVAGSMRFEAAVEVVALRGQAMQVAVPKDKGAMAVIIGLDNSAILSICKEAAEKGVVSPANFNSVGQTVVAGQVAAVDQVIILAKAKGAKRAKRIPVSVPSHCALMKPAQIELIEKLKDVDIKPPDIPVIHNFDVMVHNDVDKIREVLTEQLIYPVRWVETVLKMQEQGVDLFVECGPGKVLAGLNKRIAGSIATKTINTAHDLHSTIQLAEEKL